ncbi:hypothetical protein KCU95_g16778, partial [Aureobasidium melanogenum]
MKTSAILLSLLSSIAIVAAVPVSHSTRTSEDSVAVLTGTRLSPITTTFGTMVRRAAAHEFEQSDLDNCENVCNYLCWLQGGCTPDSYSRYLEDDAASSKSAWTSRLLEHYSSTHVAAKPTADADGMSISWRTSQLSPVTTSMGTVVRRTAPYKPTHTSEKDCPYVCNSACWFEGGCTDEAYSSYLSAEAADYKSSWDSRLLEHWSSTHIEPKPTSDAEGMSISWRTIEPSPVTTTPSTVVKRSDGIRDPHWFSGPTNIAELDCPNVCNWACFYHRGCTDEAYQAWLDETSKSYSSAWSSRLMSHYNATHVPAKPTADASGMSISWRTIYPNSTGMA